MADASNPPLQDAAVSDPSVEEQARIAAELYSMLLEGTSFEDPRFLHLTTAYPESAALALSFVSRYQPPTEQQQQFPAAEPPVVPPVFVQPPPPPPAPTAVRASPASPPGVTVFRRIDVLSFAQVVGWFGFILALVKVTMTGFLAITCAVFGSFYPHAELIVENVVKMTRSENLYRTLRQFFNLQVSASQMTPAMVLTSMPTEMYLVAFLPIVAGILSMITAAIFAHLANKALAATGGLRLHRD